MYWVCFGMGLCFFALCLFFIGLCAMYVRMIFGFFLVYSLVVDGVVRSGIFIYFLCYVFLILCLTCGIGR